MGATLGSEVCLGWRAVGACLRVDAWTWWRWEMGMWKARRSGAERAVTRALVMSRIEGVVHGWRMQHFEFSACIALTTSEYSDRYPNHDVHGIQWARPFRE